MTRKESMVYLFNKAKEDNAKYIFTTIDLGYDKDEIIINPIDNVDEKIKYLSKTYNDELEHPHAPVRITGFGYVHNISQLEYAIANPKGVN